MHRRWKSKEINKKEKHIRYLNKRREEELENK